jgi:glycosyltransferase involved in cell wall biosynthesis
MRVFLISPSLNNLSGHYYTYTRGIYDELEKRGHEVIVCCAAKADEDVRGRITARPVFSRDIYAEAGRDPSAWALQNFFYLNGSFSQDLRNGTPDIKADDVVVLCRYFNHELPYISGRPNVGMIPLLYRFAIQDLLSAHNRVKVVCDSPELTAAYEKMTGSPIGTIPAPFNNFADEEPVAVEPRRPGAPLRVAFVGHCSRLKGFHHLPEVIERCKAAGKDFTYTIQASGAETADTSLLQALDTLAAKPEVTLLRGLLDKAEYRRAMEEADIVLLPYMPIVYRLPNSGVFSEACTLGKVMVVPDNTWMQAQAVRFETGSGIFKQWEPPSIAEALCTVADDFENRETMAKAAQKPWMEYHCHRTLVDVMLDYIGQLQQLAVAGAPATR